MTEERNWFGRARVALGSIGTCSSCYAKDVAGIELRVVEQHRAYARIEPPLAELCLECAVTVTDGLVTLLQPERQDAVHSAIRAVREMRTLLDEAGEQMKRAEAFVAEAQKFESTPRTREHRWTRGGDERAYPYCVFCGILKSHTARPCPGPTPVP